MRTIRFAANMPIDKILEYIGVISGIASVWFSKKENTLVYPVGLVNTILYIYISLKGNLIGEASVNLYYTVVSIYGWILWTRKDKKHQVILHITHSSTKEWMQHILFFLSFYVALFLVLSFLKKDFPGAIPWADSFASATAYTGMWLMAKKKVESWYWWIATNIASIPLYFVKGYSVTSVYYMVLLVLAFFGLSEWKQKSVRVKTEKLRTA
jgi:nicotinamide mononucleotide transporter